MMTECIENSILDKVKCYVALGSNMGDSYAYLQQAIADLEAHQAIDSLKISRFYQSKPHGPQDQPDYLNAAVSFLTQIDPEDLLDLLQSIENKNNRVREGVVRWGARTLDLDLLFYADKSIDTPRLCVPHPRICERSFVLFPLRDLLSADPQLYSEINKNPSIADCINKLSKEELNNIKELSID